MGANRKQPSRARARRPIASSAMSTSKMKAAADTAHLERKHVTATGDNDKARPTDSPPQETPQSVPPDSRMPAPFAGSQQEAQQATASQREAQEAAAAALDEDRQPTAPRIPAAPPKTEAHPEDNPPAPPAPAATPSASPGVDARAAGEETGHRPGQAPADEGAEEPDDAAATLADLGWMPPAEDRVAQFLNDVADIAPPPARERQAAAAPGFVLPAAISPEEAERKKAKAEPFWSQVVATPMEQPAPPARPRRITRKRQRARQRWLILAAVILLVIAALAALVILRL